MIILDMFSNIGNNYDYTKTRLPFVDAKVVMNNWLQNLHKLVYVPWRYEEYMPIYVQPGPPEYHATSGEPTPVSDAQVSAWANDPDRNKDKFYQYDLRRNGVNFVRAVRNIFYQARVA
jgi:hypothetical protein